MILKIRTYLDSTIIFFHCMIVKVSSSHVELISKVCQLSIKSAKPQSCGSLSFKGAAVVYIFGVHGLRDICLFWLPLETMTATTTTWSVLVAFLRLSLPPTLSFTEQRPPPTYIEEVDTASFVVDSSSSLDIENLNVIFTSLHSA